MPLVLPGHIARELEAERELGKSIAWVEDFNRRLRAIDPCLELVKARETTAASGLIPGCWHVKRACHGAPDAFFPIAGPNGEYVEPTEAHIDELRSRDLHNPNVWREHLARTARRQREHDRECERQREGRRDELATNIKALASPSIFMGAKTARAKGRRDK